MGRFKVGRCCLQFPFDEEFDVFERHVLRVFGVAEL